MLFLFAFVVLIQNEYPNHVDKLCEVIRKTEAATSVFLIVLGYLKFCIRYSRVRSSMMLAAWSLCS